MTRFDEAMRFVAKWEGGRVDHPADPGGRTNRGITQANFNAYLNRIGKPNRDVFTLTDEECNDIYFSDYWLKAHCDKLPAPLDLIQFDTAVQRGPFKARQMLQRALGVMDDGIIGPQTMAAVSKCVPVDVAKRYAIAREMHYIQRVGEDRKSAVFLAGWLNRLHDLETRLA
jgi:lysozyme family protein